ncbi:MAG: phosphatase PAP2 family protein [Phycisphaerales bacterium]|nr:phosphatase PAP2 family protein [Phycisphaerales bacterium]
MPLPRVLRTVARHELALLSLIAALAALLFIFAKVAGAVIHGSADELDKRLLLALRNPADTPDPIGPPWVEEMARDFTALGGIGVLAFLVGALALLLLLQGKSRTVGLLAASIGGGFLLSSAFKHAIERPRPNLVPHGSLVYTTSFPSGHSTMAAVTYLTLGALLMRTDKRPLIKLYLLALAVTLTVLVGVSRVYLGVHWPTDVLAGWTLGAAWAIACWIAARRLQRGGQVEEATADTLP